MKRSILLPLLLAAPVLVALRPSGDQVRVQFKPQPGSSLTKTFSVTSHYTLEEMQVLMNGEENPMMPQMEMDMENTLAVTVTDTYGKVADGRPVSLDRSYDSIDTEFNMSMTAEGGPAGTETATPSGSGTSPLEGLKVHFQWNAEDSDYDATWADEEAQGEDEWLEGLEMEMDLRDLLPARPLTVGDRYEIPLEGLVSVVAPGGDLKIDMQIDGDEASMGPADPELMTNMRRMFSEILRGKASGTLSEVREGEDGRFAVIEIDLDVDSNSDMSDLVQEAMEMQRQEGLEISLNQADVHFALEGKGTLEWDLDQGRVHSLDLSGDTSMEMEMEMEMNFGPQSMLMEMSMEMSGSLDIGVTTGE